jgi:hypothetical protein
VWRDPDFDASLHAFYYVRVLQIPTPRWSTYDAKKLGVPPPKRVSPTVQERAWTSPIWYTPVAQGGARPGDAARCTSPGRRRSEGLVPGAVVRDPFVHFLAIGVAILAL